MYWVQGARIDEWGAVHAHTYAQFTCEAIKEGFKLYDELPTSIIRNIIKSVNGRRFVSE